MKKRILVAAASSTAMFLAMSGWLFLATPASSTEELVEPEDLVRAGCYAALEMPEALEEELARESGKMTGRFGTQILAYVCADRELREAFLAGVYFGQGYYGVQP